MSASAAPTRMRFPSTSTLPKPRAESRTTTPVHAAVADEQVGAEPDDGDRNLLRQRPHQEGKILRVGRHGQDLRRPAGAEPDDRRERLVRLQRAAEAGEILAQAVEEMVRHRRPPRTSFSQREKVCPEAPDEGGCGRN